MTPSVPAAIPPPPIEGFELGPLNIALYGILIAVGAYLALRLVISRYTAYGGDPGLAEKAGLVALGAGLLGARVAYLIPRLDRYLDNPISMIQVWEGGLSFFGGLVFGAVGVVWYVHVKAGDLPAMADAVAPALPLAQAIGRWGNYFNQELFGRPTDLPWALEVEAHRRPAQYREFTTFHPTFLYEFLWNLALVGVILWVGRRGRLRRGSLMFVYLIGAGIGRGWIEALRVDTVDRYLGLSRNNWFALLVLVIGIVGLVLWQRRGHGESDVVEDTGSEPDAGVEADSDRDTGAEPAEGQDVDDATDRDPE